MIATNTNVILTCTHIGNAYGIFPGELDETYKATLPLSTELAIEHAAMQIMAMSNYRAIEIDAPECLTKAIAWGDFEPGTQWLRIAPDGITFCVINDEDWSAQLEFSLRKTGDDQ